MSDYTENRNAALNAVAELNTKYEARSTCFVKTPFMEEWRPTRLASHFHWSPSKEAIVVRVDGLVEPVVADWVAPRDGITRAPWISLPGDRIYENRIHDADLAVEEHQLEEQRISTVKRPLTLVPATNAYDAMIKSRAFDKLSKRATEDRKKFTEACEQLFACIKEQDIGQVHDGYHTFNELYAHRVRLFVCLMHAHKNRAWWSFLHSDGTQWKGWVIAGIETPAGSATYYLPESAVDDLPVGTNIARGKEWDGHTADDVLQRLLSLNNGMTDGSTFEHLPLPTECVFQYSASVNLPQGVVHFDGIVTGKEIASIEDYQHYRAMIAADAKAQPEQVQVHSFCIVGAK